MNPLTVHTFDINAGKVKTSLLDMCMTPSGTALDIFNPIDHCMTLFDVPWSNCIALEEPTRDTATKSTAMLLSMPAPDGSGQKSVSPMHCSNMSR